jgi:hypothetical protein
VVATVNDFMIVGFSHTRCYHRYLPQSRRLSRCGSASKEEPAVTKAVTGMLSNSDVSRGPVKLDLREKFNEEARLPAWPKVSQREAWGIHNNNVYTTRALTDR